jgi:DNA-binding Lrp family transcriptional regulator
MQQIDPVDEALLAQLRNNARATTSELARQLGLSRSTVQSRLNKLLERRVITGFTVQLGESYAHSMIRAHVLIELDQKLTGQAHARLKKMPKVVALHAISGAYDMIAIVEAHSTDELSRLLDEIADLDGIARTNSSVILETKFER